MKRYLAMGAVICLALGLGGVAAGHPEQHGTDDGHLLNPVDPGDLEFLSTLELTATNDLIADVGVDPNGNYAYLANWGEPDCAANSEAGGRNSADAGVYVVDITNLSAPKQIGFIPHSQDSRPGEGVQAVKISTKFFNGTMLVTNNEQCGKNGKGGVSLFDVTNPAKPYKLSEHFGDKGGSDTNDIHSAFAWDAGNNAYVVMTDNFETTDVDIMDITNPKRPRLIADLNLNTKFGQRIDQEGIGLQESSLHDMVVKQIGGKFIMLLSYWDGGYVLLDVTNPASPVFLGDSDYEDPDPELFESSGRTEWPEGNGHQAEFTSDNEFFIATDEDFSPYRANLSITSGPFTGQARPAGEFGFTPPLAEREDPPGTPDPVIEGPTIFGGYGCTISHDDPVPPASSLTAAPGEEKIIVFERGPVGDPNHSHDACFFSEKIEAGALAGYDAVIVANHHSGAQNGAAADAHFCGGQGHVAATVESFCIGHKTMHDLFNTTPAYTYSSLNEPAEGTVGQKVRIEPEFDGWGYVHLFETPNLTSDQTPAAIDTFAVDEAHDPDYASGYGDLSVHEVATDPLDPNRAYLSYYSAGMRMIEIQCSDQSDNSTCELVQVGGYLDTDGIGDDGNDFWGVEAFAKGNTTYVLGSDRDSGLYIFRAKP